MTAMCMGNPLWFALKYLDFHPDPKQRLVLESHARRGLLNCTRQWGKSTITALLAVHQAWSQPESLTIVVSPSARQSAEFVRKASAFLRKLDIRPRGDGDNEISLQLPNGARIVGLPGTEGTIRGFSAVSLLLIDEAARVEEAMYKAVRPMLATSDGSLWLMSTPHGRSGFFYEEWSRNEVGQLASGNRWPRERKDSLRSIGNRPEQKSANAATTPWKRISVPATECPRISPAFLAEEKASMGDMWFRQEYMCEFIHSGQSLFRHDLILDAISHDVQPFPL